MSGNKGWWIAGLLGLGVIYAAGNDDSAPEADTTTEVVSTTTSAAFGVPASTSSPDAIEYQATTPDAGTPDYGPAQQYAEDAEAAEEESEEYASGGDGYINVDGNFVSSPVEADEAPPGASAECEDGTYSFSQNRRGTCSGHGGVANWL